MNYAAFLLPYINIFKLRIFYKNYEPLFFNPNFYFR